MIANGHAIGAARALARTAAAVDGGAAGARSALGDLGERALGGTELARLGSGDVATGWGLRPIDLTAARAAEARGVRLLNRASAVEHAHRKVNLAPVLDAAGIPHVADGIAVRTRGELERAVAALGGEARLTGGFSHSRVSEASNVPTGLGGAPEPVVVRDADQLKAFADTHLDHSRTFLVQRVPDGQEIHVATAGSSVVHEAGPGAGLARAEQELASSAARAFGLDAAGVDLVRGRDGALRVLDVHATPRGLSAAELAKLAGSTRFADGIGTAAPASGAIAEQVEQAKVAVGVLNMGRLPGKNISRTLAEVERQGGRPVFLSAPTTAIGQDGGVLLAGMPTPVDVVLTRTGSVISDDALATLRALEDAGVPVINGSRPMALVRDKNVQARTLVDAGVPHPTTTTVSGVADVDDALSLIGPSMVLKNPASSEGRGVMFLEGQDVVRGVARLFEKRTADSRLVARTASGSQLELVDRESAERAILELGRATAVEDAVTGARLLKMQQPVMLADLATGAAVQVDQPVTVISVADAFRDARPGATLKAETWFREAAGVDTRIHVGRGVDGEHRVLAAMERRVAPNEFGEARSNLSLGGAATAIVPDARQEATAIAAARAFDLDVAGVDLIASRRGPVVLEVNASPGLDIEKATGAVADRWINVAMLRGEARRSARAGA